MSFCKLLNIRRLFSLICPTKQTINFQRSNIRTMDDGFSWPSQSELNEVREIVSKIAGKCIEDVRVVASPYRICPLGAHIDHQGGTVSAMTINKGILLGFIPSGNTQVILRSGQFNGEVRFRIDEVQCPKCDVNTNDSIDESDLTKPREECSWRNYARGALYALQRKGNRLFQGITGYICGSEGLDSSGLSSSAAVGIAYLLALETANNLAISPVENIEYDRLIENEYLGLRNGILDQSAILLSKHGCLLTMNCKEKAANITCAFAKAKEHKLINPPESWKNLNVEFQKRYKILLAFSGLKHALTQNPGYNHRVTECHDAARILLRASGTEKESAVLSDVEPEDYQLHKEKLEPNLAKRAEHYFSENSRVNKGIEAWAHGNLEEFGALITASGLSSIQNYECGSEPLIQLYETILRAPGVYGARFSGAGFRGCCVALVDANLVAESASFVRSEYPKLQPELAKKLSPDTAVLVCEAGDCARVM